jgi:hypothetical protein
VTRLAMRIAVMTAVLWGAALSAASATELLYYVNSPADAPKEARTEMKSADGEPVYLAKEPVARLDSAKVKEARIVREEIEILDEDNPVSAVYIVNLVVEDAERDKLKQSMASLCNSQAGVHMVVDGTVVGYYPFAACDSFSVAAAFTEKEAAEKFAHQLAKQVTVATPGSK